MNMGRVALVFALAVGGLLLLSGCNPVTPVVETPAAAAPAEAMPAAPTEATSAAAAEDVCAGEMTPATVPEILEALPVWSDWVEFNDPVGDWLRDHPLYAENFDAPDAFEDVDLPPALDLADLRLGPEGDTYIFSLSTSRAATGEGEPLTDLLTPGRRVASVGVYIDTDRNGVSDYLLTTTDEALTFGAVFATTLDEPVDTIELRVDENTIDFVAPRGLLGDRFDWIAFTGYSPLPDTFFRTGVGWVFVVPIVDIYRPGDIPANIGFTTSYAGTGQSCQVIESQYNSCPAQGSPTPVTVSGPGYSYQGVLIYRVQCDGRGYAFWCMNQSFFGKEVFEGGSRLGWVARCPYHCGYNQEARWDQDGDGLVDKIFHTVTDRDCGSYHDGDGDGGLDVMEHTYLYGPNEITSCNRERDYQAGTTLDLRCKPAQPPYDAPTNVPGFVP